MTRVNCCRFVINVEMQMFARLGNSKGFAFSLAVALFRFSQGTAGVGNDVVNSGCLICLRENGCRLPRPVLVA